MTRSEIEAEVCAILTASLERPIHPGERVDRLHEERWTSLKHIEILFMVEQELGIRFSAAQIGRLNSLAELVDLAETALAAGGSARATDGVSG